MMQEEIQQIIEKGKKLKIEIGKLTKDDYPKGGKNTIILGYHSIMADHHTAIHLLIEKNLVGSAFALVRSFWEPLYRAHWLYGCATDKQVKQLTEGENVFPGMGTMVEQIDEAYQTGDFWQIIKKNSWEAMNDYTHSGVRQLNRRFTEDSVEPNYEPGEIIEALNNTNMGLLMMAFFFFNVFKKREKAKTVRKMIMEYGEM
jgi:hypothetical protein